jgi:mevalonate kinase
MAKKGTALATTKAMAQEVEARSITNNADRDELADALEEDVEDLAEMIREGKTEEAQELIGEVQTALEIFTRYFNEE